MNLSTKARTSLYMPQSQLVDSTRSTAHSAEDGKIYENGSTVRPEKARGTAVNTTKR
jgi:hypothetical protein